MIGVPGPRLLPEFSPVIESTEFGRSLPRLRGFGDRLANLRAHPDLVGPDRHVHFEGRHAGVLADRGFARLRLVDVLRDDRQRLPGSGRGLLAGERRRHRGAHVRRQVGGGLRDEFDDAVEESRKHARSIIARGITAMKPAYGDKFRIERDPLGEVRVPADALYGAQTQARGRELPHQRPDRSPRARHRHRPHQEGGRAGQRVARPARPEDRRRDRRGRRRDPRRRSTATSSSWTSTRPAPAPPTT